MGGYHRSIVERLGRGLLRASRLGLHLWLGVAASWLPVAASSVTSLWTPVASPSTIIGYITHRLTLRTLPGEVPLLPTIKAPSLSVARRRPPWWPIAPVPPKVIPPIAGDTAAPALSRIATWASGSGLGKPDFEEAPSNFCSIETELYGEILNIATQGGNIESE